ncbi:hypothetical protein COU37_04630 [Candidatus Micrarchaeota archaeon CG10_big_fil_rev_8_21_14_0_10_45_29]|nr:MAG: hypothetical protein COU37_04630 [Candidatus Micrarchaeota archaeon CG10_big_fil_rev_8_21_14_0_10_45_29]
MAGNSGQGVAEQTAQLAKKEKIPTQISGLDSILGGGLFQGTNLLLHGSPLCGKKPLLMQFIYEGLRSDIPGVFVLTDFGYKEWKTKMASSGWDLAPFEKNGALHVIDCYSSQFEPSLQDEPHISHVPSPNALSAISLQLAKMQEKMGQNFGSYNLAFHSLSSLLEESTPSTFHHFLQFTAGKLRKSGATSIYSLELGMHDEKDVTMVEHIMDGVIEFQEGKVRIKGLEGASHNWHDYTIMPHGIEIR